MVIDLQNLHKRYNQNRVLKGITLQFGPGQIYAVLGPNGSGKTTMMKSILGLVQPEQGQLTVLNHNALKEHGYRSDMAYAPQIARFPENLTVMDVVGLITNIRKQESNAEQFIALFEIGEYKNERLKNLSGGTRQKVNLVLTFMFDCSVYVLDEPTSGLDPINCIRLKELLVKLKERGKTILVTTHILHLAQEISDQVVFLLEGKIKYNGPTDKLIRTYKSDNLEQAIAQLLSDSSHQEETPVVHIQKEQKHA